MLKSGKQLKCIGPLERLVSMEPNRLSANLICRVVVTYAPFGIRAKFGPVSCKLLTPKSLLDVGNGVPLGLVEVHIPVRFVTKICAVLCVIKRPKIFLGLVWSARVKPREGVLGWSPLLEESPATRSFTD